MTNVSSWLDKLAGAWGPVVARDGHLYTGDRRIKFLGVNLCFGANFPTHADADAIARRMAKFGINCVRFHHMDMFSAPAGIPATLTFPFPATGTDTATVTLGSEHRTIWYEVEIMQ